MYLSNSLLVERSHFVCKKNQLLLVILLFDSVVMEMRTLVFKNGVVKNPLLVNS